MRAGEDADTTRTSETLDQTVSLHKTYLMQTHQNIRGSRRHRQPNAGRRVAAAHAMRLAGLAAAAGVAEPSARSRRRGFQHTVRDFFDSWTPSGCLAKPARPD
jgi:hypothetical protein